MKIIIFSHAAGSPYHGPNMRWYYLGRVLQQKGCNVTIVGSSFFHKYEKDQKQKRHTVEKNIDGINYIFLKNYHYKNKLGQVANQIKFLISSFIWAKKIGKKREYDIVVASSPPPFCAFSAYMLSKWLKKPFLFETRDLWPLVIQDLGNISDKNPYIKLVRLFEKFSVSRASKVVSVKKGDYWYFKDVYNLPESRFSYQPNGFLADRSNLEKENNQKCKGSTFTVGYTGAMSSYYGLFELLKAAELLKHDKSISFVLVGGGEGYFELQKYAEQKDLTNVVFIGKVPKSEIPKYLSSFDVCYVGLKDVRANLYGISCNKIFEYMHAEKPIIASYETYFDPVLEAGCGITVRPESPSEIVNSIIYLKYNPAVMATLGAKAGDYFRKNHDFSVIGTRYFILMEETIKGG